MQKTDTVRVKRGSAGLGLFANAPFTKHDLVIEYTGALITADEADQRGGKYLFELNDHWTIDGSGRENVARYVNHSCRPNCYAELSADEKRVYIYAQKKICPGDELTYHYGKDYFTRIIQPVGCRCKKCESAR